MKSIVTVILLFIYGSVTAQLSPKALKTPVVQGIDKSVLNDAYAFFKHKVTGGNTLDGTSQVDHPFLRKNPDAILVACAEYGFNANFLNKGLVLQKQRDGLWSINTLKQNAEVQGFTLHIIAAKPGSSAFVHTTTAANVTANYTKLDHPLLNGNPAAKFLVMQVESGVATAPVGLRYLNGSWCIVNHGLLLMKPGAVFNVIIDNRITQYTKQQMQGQGIDPRYAALSGSVMNNNENAFVIVNQVSDDDANMNPSEVATTYMPGPDNAGYWFIQNQNKLALKSYKAFNVFILPSAVNGFTKGSDFKMPSAKPLKGYVDFHAHLMSHLGFGQKAMHGVPDIGSLVPAGNYNCNPQSFRATTIEQALSSCNGTHGGWGADNPCGDYLRAMILSVALDHKNKFNVPFERNAHGDHEHDGYPGLKYWPNQGSILHQQMYVDWIKRAYDGGLRVMVALAVNNEMIAELINGTKPYDDKYVVDLQIQETKNFVQRHSDFMEVAYSSADLYRIISNNKMAVILGVEVDNIGNFHKQGIACNETTVKAEINRLYNAGIRYVFPIHLVDNKFGGTAVYSMLFNYANKYSTGKYFTVETSRDPRIAFNVNIMSVDGVNAPPGLENGLIGVARGLAEGIGQLPAPCMNDAIKCFPPPGKVSCCGSYQSIVNVMTFNPSLDLNKNVKPGHVNKLGLTSIGEFAIKEMMKLGMFIDVDHMSQKSLARTFEIAESVPGKYPLIMGHSGLLANGGKERHSDPAMVRRLAATGGMFGVGPSDNTARQFATQFRNVFEIMGAAGIGVGTDVNGFEPLPRRPLTSKIDIQGQSNYFYGKFSAATGITTKSSLGNREWDYIKDEGVPHYGLMPEFFFDAFENNQQLNGLTGKMMDMQGKLMSSANDFYVMWQKCDRAKTTVR